MLALPKADRLNHLAGHDTLGIRHDWLVSVC